MPFTAAESGWRAQLALGFATDGAVTRLVERRHAGPLRVQKPLYPEGPETCHAIIVHPPGGIAGGDALSISMRVGKDASALVTTPGAGKWYKANGRSARQDIHIAVAENATLEWLPQETIVFDAAVAGMQTEVELEEGARYMGSEILCFGRTASGEIFRSGTLSQRMTIRLAGRPIWFEQGRLEAGTAGMTGPLGLAGKTVCATCIVVGRAVPAPLITAVREQAAAATDTRGRFGLTQMKQLTVARYLGDSSEQARLLMGMVWQTLRPTVIGREAVIPRIWNT